jgi:hypothetical protein
MSDASAIGATHEPKNIAAVRYVMIRMGFPPPHAKPFASVFRKAAIYGASRKVALRDKSGQFGAFRDNTDKMRSKNALYAVVRRPSGIALIAGRRANLIISARDFFISSDQTARKRSEL